MIDWNAEWWAAHERSSLKVTTENAARWRDFWSQDADFYLRDVNAESTFYDLVVDRLVKEGWARPIDAVLDVGSGPGTLALPISARVRSVTALDEADGMLETLRKECAARKILNIEAHRSSWGDFDREGGYDLVMASLSPAITSAKDLWSMERASRDRCCLICPCPCDWMAVRNELWRAVVGDFSPSDAYSAKYPMNILLDQGRDTELFIIRSRTETSHPAHDVVEHYLRYFRIFTEMDERKEDTVKEYVLSRARNGSFRKEGEKCLHLLCWRTPRK